MIRYGVLIICLLFVRAANGQEFVTLRSVPFTTFTDEIVYIDSIIDERAVKNLGIHKNLNGEPTTLKLFQGVEESLKHFFNLTLPYDSLGEAITVKVRALNVQASKRRMNDGIAEVARAHVELVFCKREGGELKELYTIKHNEDAVFGLYDKWSVYYTHEQRIRASLEYCVHAFLRNYITIKPKLNATDFKAIEENKDLDVHLGQWFNLVTAKWMQSRYFQGYGITYTGFVDSKKGFIKPYELSFEVNWARDDVAAENGYSDVNAFVFRPELYFIYKRLTKGIYATASANIPLGFELLEDLEEDNSINFVVGVGASQGLRIIPWQRKGVVIGADFFQQFETSKIYRFDYGVEFVLGINF